jgi:hypothetical protein
MLSKTTILFGRGRDLESMPRQIEVGLGDAPGLAHGRLSLNHKQSDANLRSATEFVSLASEEDVAAWATAIPFAATQSPFDGMVIAVEDASPDTCLALIALARRLTRGAIHQTWLQFASEWEQGETGGSGSPERMAGALVSALTHGLFGSTRPEIEDVQPAGRKALLCAIEYLQGLMDLQIDPWSVPRILPPGADVNLRQLHASALASVQRERTVYERVYESALKVQLSLPLRGTRRSIDIDAIFMTEVELTGTLKVLLRSDTRAPYGRGYSMWGLHRPTLAGSGGDMTVSVDPSAGVDLRDLWIALEQAEESSWEKYAQSMGPAYGRPREPAREGMISYREEPRIAVPSQQPWWEGRPLYTLIGAPRRVTIAGAQVPGSRLSWDDVMQIVWQIYSPVQRLRVRRTDLPDETPWSILDPGAERARTVLVHERTQLSAVRLTLGSPSDGVPVPWNNTIGASLAAFVDVGRSELDRLPHSGEFDVMEDRGGIALVTARGVLLLDSRSEGSFPMADLHRAAADVATTLDCARGITGEINETIRTLVERAVSYGKASDKRDALKAIYAAKLRARQTWSQSGRFEEDILVRRFREFCERRWNADERLAVALEEIDELESMVVSSSEIRANTTLNAIAFLGFPLSIFGNLLGGLLILDDTKASVVGFSAHVVYAWAGLSMSALGLVWLFSTVSNTLWRQDGEK